MILIIDAEGTEHEYSSGSRFFTDEHNNLCVEDSRQRLLAVFAAGCWRNVGGHDED